jgi:hypothetical protein
MSASPAAYLPITSDEDDMLIAQGLGEYGALTGGGSSQMTDFVGSIGSTIQDMEPSTWLMVLGGLLVVWFLFFRR